MLGGVPLHSTNYFPGISEQKKAALLKQHGLFGIALSAKN
jgi:hypothetical protein